MAGLTQIVRWHACADTTALARAARDWIVAAAARAIGERGRFDLVLAGGNTPRAAYCLLRDANSDGTRADWSRWRIWFGDERCAPPDDPQRNSAMARAAWLDHVAIPAANICAIPAELGARTAADRYATMLHDIGDFDLVLLGLGEDGHTASLFPGHAEGIRADAPNAVAVFNAPKPPPERVSLSAARLARARQVLFLVEGAGKADAVARWRAGAALPAASITPSGGVDVLIATTSGSP
ncbi:MAG: 6-phosphogluconolactonase [Proteobacteria bacterium]|nr:6-phosphogluconolactonase [Pseudomonadota bacterium]MBS0463208.1 6-phosphogluconolactonase [Pseudomonadota bacterium]MBS0465337.1 6-phosphogluconolactonase [Pseudomonadota bacterium]